MNRHWVINRSLKSFLFLRVIPIYKSIKSSCCLTRVIVIYIFTLYWKRRVGILFFFFSSYISFFFYVDLFTLITFILFIVNISEIESLFFLNILLLLFINRSFKGLYIIIITFIFALWLRSAFFNFWIVFTNDASHKIIKKIRSFIILLFSLLLFIIFIILFCYIGSCWFLWGFRRTDYLKWRYLLFKYQLILFFLFLLLLLFFSLFLLIILFNSFDLFLIIIILN